MSARMRASSLWLLGVVAVFAIGCNSIKYPEQLTCGSKGECPPGQTCQEGFCRVPGSAAGGHGGTGGASGTTGTGGGAAGRDGGSDGPDGSSCVKKTCAAEQKNCGMILDGCGGMLNCGT